MVRILLHIYPVHDKIIQMKLIGRTDAPNWGGEREVGATNDDEEVLFLFLILYGFLPWISTEEGSRQWQ